MMKAKIQKWGNSLALRIPKSLANEIGIELSSPVEVISEDGKLVVTPDRGSHFMLEDLLEKITENNLHNEFETGGAVGKEIW